MVLDNDIRMKVETSPPMAATTLARPLDLLPPVNQAYSDAFTSMRVTPELKHDQFLNKPHSPISHTTSSLRSSQELHDTDTSIDEPSNFEIYTRAAPKTHAHEYSDDTVGQVSPQRSIAGTKRTANGQVKYRNHMPPALDLSKNSHHERNVSSLSTSSASMVDLSQQLRTRLTYAMVKVQNGWQNRSLEEVESIASASPRSTIGFHSQWNATNLQSPRTAIAANFNREHSSSTSSGDSYQRPTPAEPSRHLELTMQFPARRKGLAPPADIVPGQRRRPTPNTQCAIGRNGQPITSSRPTISQRTPSQTAGMEADAVETLLFMASPNNSGRASQFSPVPTSATSRHFPSQTSPLRNTFSLPNSPKRVAFQSDITYAHRYGRDKHTIIESMLERLDDDSNADLDEAIRLMDHHHATKVMT